MLTSSGRVVAVLALLLATWTVPRAPSALAAVTGDDLPSAILGVLEVGLLALSCWTALALGLASLRGGPGRLGRRLLPSTARAVLLSGALIVTATPSVATEVPWPVDGLQLPERVALAPSGPESATTRADRPPRTDPPEVVVVQAGDTLWSLAAERLGAAAGPSPGPNPAHRAVAAAVDDLHRANRDVIGPDPDLIHPGQRLVVPSAGDTGDAR